jgi:hypothetical protein
MTSTKDIKIYQVVISPQPSTFLPTNHSNRYLSNPTYLVTPTSLVVFPTDPTTTKKFDKRNKMRGSARNLELFTQAIFKGHDFVWLTFI